MMQYKTFTLNNFRGGLNTSVDESMLGPTESPDLSNVDILDSGAITRRNGYRDVLSLADPVKALFRYYRASGAKAWVVAAGQKVYTRQDSVQDVPLTVLEAESATRSGGSVVTPRSGYDVSGGRVVRVTGSATFDIPYSTSVMVRGALKDSALSVDGGAAVLATGHSYAWTGLAATSHTVKVTPPVRNDSLLRLTPQGMRNARWVHRTVPNLPTQDGQEVKMRVSLRIYDRLTHAHRDDSDIQLQIIDTGNTSNYFYLGQLMGESTSRYIWNMTGYSRMQHSNRANGWRDMSVALTIVKGGLHGGSNSGFVSIDSPLVNNTNPIQGLGYSTTLFVNDLSNLKIRVRAETWVVGWRSNWADSLRINDALYDDFESLSGWEGGGDATGYPDAVVNEDGQPWSADQYTYVDVDAFTYQASGDMVEVGTISDDEHVGIAKMLDRAYFSTASDDVRYTTGASGVSVSASGTTKGAHLIEFKRRMFAAGIGTDRSLLNYTEVDAPNDWTGGSIRLAGRDSGGECTGLAAFDNLLFYFSPTRVYALDTTGTDDQWVSKLLHSTYGCVAPKSLVSSANGLIFLSDDGVRSYGYLKNIYAQDGSGIMLLSDNIRPTIASVTNKGIAAGAMYKGRYWLSCALDGAEENNAILVCDTDAVREDGQPAWTRYDIAGVTCFETTSGDEYALYAGMDDGRIVQLDFGESDNGLPIPLSYQIPPLPVGGYETEKHFRHMHITAFSDTTQSITLTPETDDVDGVVSNIVLDPQTAVRPRRVPLSARGRFIKTRVDSAGSNQPVTVSAITYTFRPSPRLR